VVVGVRRAAARGCGSSVARSHPLRKIMHASFIFRAKWQSAKNGSYRGSHRIWEGLLARKWHTIKDQ